MNKFILSILMTIATIGSVNAFTGANYRKRQGDQRLAALKDVSKNADNKAMTAFL